MTNAQTNKKFLSAIDAKTRSIILTNIANHYGVTQAQAYAEVTDNDAEHLLDYVTGPERSAVSLFMRTAQ